MLDFGDCRAMNEHEKWEDYRRFGNPPIFSIDIPVVGQFSCPSCATRSAHRHRLP